MPLTTPEELAAWPKEEAQGVIEMLEFLVTDLSHDAVCQYIIKERQHWIKVFDDADDMAVFCDEMNKSDIVKYINFYF